ncbi:uncharacterized protein [Montipora foliosa]|uniref:uncharacterized protein n=1 Tax=Montipora foliosa TaxID=591990 RepID=UPI0035F13C8A
MFRCNLCFDFVAFFLRQLLHHIGKKHRHEPNFHVLCGIDGCTKTYKNFISYRNHMIRKHEVTRTEQNDTTDEDSGILDNCDSGSQSSTLDEWCQEMYDLDTGGDFDLNQETEQTRKANALCLLSFKERGRVPQTVVDSFVESSTQIARNSINMLKSGLISRLNTAGIQFSAVPGLRQLFGESNLSMDPFSGINRESLQYGYYKEHFHLVEPRKIILGVYHTKARRGCKLKTIQKSDEAFYIPLIESLQQLLNDESILEEVENPHQRNDDLLCDFCDGDMFQEHPLFGTDPYALQVIVYFDELEVCNPLGSRATKHKIGAFYYTLGNIQPQNRSHMNAIQLLGLVHNKHIKKYGIEPILEAFLTDLDLLEMDEGYDFCIRGELRTFRGSVAFCSGDNLGSQLLGGYKQGSQSYRKCRECMRNSEELEAHNKRQL